MGSDFFELPALPVPFGWGGYVLEMEYDESLLQYLHCLH